VLEGALLDIGEIFSDPESPGIQPVLITRGDTCMQNKTTMRILPAMVLAAFSGASGAAGFQLLEQNASGIGNAYAGSAAVAENASTVFFNPAGMSELKGTNASGGVSLVQTSFKFNNNGSSTGALSGDGGDGGVLAAVPNAYLTKQLDNQLSIGIGLGAPFGLRTKYDDPWLGGAQAQEFDVKTINLNPSVAFKVSESVSLGAGANYQKLEVEYTRIASVSPSIAIAAPPAPPINGTQHRVTLKADDAAWGWNVGALFKLSPATNLGVSYRSKSKYTVEGDIAVTGGSTPLAPNFNASQSSDAKVDIELPDTFILSGTHSVSDRLTLLADVSWTGWSSIQKVNIVRTSGTQSGVTAQTLDADFDDTWRVALGGNYQYSPMVKMKFGIAYDQTPVKGASTRLVSLPDNDRLWLSIGSQYALSNSSALDVGFAYLVVKESDINNNQAASGRGTVTGTFDAKVMLLGAQYSTSF
jgi:long-chain fatty acid transport protein